MHEEHPTILLADDDAAWRQAMQARLEHEGFQIVSAANGNEAVTRFDENTIDLALLDAQLPDIDGFGVCEHIRCHPRGSQIPVVFLTGSDSGIIRRHLRALTATVGGDRCLTKTCGNEQLLRTIREVLPASPAVASR